MSSGYEQQALADAQTHRFDPYHLRPLASLNRRRFIALPGLDGDEVNKSGWELLSKRALIERIRPHVPALGLEGVPDGDLPEQLNAILAGLDRPHRELDERARQYLRNTTPMQLGPGYDSSWMTLECTHWRDRDEQLFALAGEVAETIPGQR